MRRSWTFILTLALLMTLANADFASAKKTRSKGASSRSSVKRAQRGRTARTTARRARNGRKTLAARGKRGRRLARSRGRSRQSSYELQPATASGPPRPAPGIPTERVSEIQTALIKAGYMDGPASGLYDEATIDAMKEFQAKNGLSQTGLPSAMLLKKLGVSKRANDGYAVPVNRVSETDKKRPGSEQP